MERQPKQEGSKARYLYRLFFASLAFSFRFAGVAALLTLAISELRGRSWRKGLPLAALAFAPFVLFVIYGKINAAGTWSYTDELLGLHGGVPALLSHLAAGLAYQAGAIGAVLGDCALIGGTSSLRYVVAALALLGFLQCCRKKFGTPEIFLLASLFVNALAPVHLERYLIPLVPLLAVYLVLGIQFSFSLIAQRTLRFWSGMNGMNDTNDTKRIHPLRVSLFVAAGISLLHVHAMAGIYQLRHAENRFDPPPGMRKQVAAVYMNQWEEGWIHGNPQKVHMRNKRFASFIMLMDGMRQALPEDAVLAGRKPRLMSYLAGRYCVALPDETDPAKLHALLEGLGVTHIVQDALYARTMKVLEATRDKLGLRRVLVLGSASCLELPSRVRPPR